MKYRATRTTLVRAEPSRRRGRYGLHREEHRIRGHCQPRRHVDPCRETGRRLGQQGRLRGDRSTTREPVQRDGFVQRCVIAEWTFNASEGISPWVVVADYLIARAIIETDIENLGAADGSDAVGPLRVSSAEWSRLSSERRRARGRLPTRAPRSPDPAGGRCRLSHASRREKAERAARRCRQDPGQRSLCADAIRGLPRLSDR